MKKYINFEMDLMSLRCLEALLFFQVSLHLQVKGCREALNVDDLKTRDLKLMENEGILNELKECLLKVGELSNEVLERDLIPSKISAVKLNSGIRFLIRAAITYSSDPLNRLKMIVEVSVE